MAATSVRARVAGLFLGLPLALPIVACGSGGGFPDARPPDGAAPGGHFALAWALTDTAGQPVTCDQLGALSVTAAIHNRAVEGGEPEVFSCSSGSGESQGVSPGIY